MKYNQWVSRGKLRMDPEHSPSRFVLHNKKGKTSALLIFALSNFCQKKKQYLEEIWLYEISQWGTNQTVTVWHFISLHNIILFSLQFSGLFSLLFSAIMNKVKPKLIVSLFLRKTENTTAGVPLGNLCKTAHATVNETVKSRLFSLNRGFKQVQGSQIPQPCTDTLLAWHINFISIETTDLSWCKIDEHLIFD